MNRYQIEFVDGDGKVVLSRAGSLRELTSLERRRNMPDDVAVFIRQLGVSRDLARGSSR